MKLEHSVSLVGCGYNDEDSITDFFQNTVDALEAVGTDYEIVFIDNCSTDRTWALAQGFVRANNRIRAYRNDCNRDVGYSLKRGVSVAQKEILFWQNVDQSFDLSDLRIFLELMQHFGVVVGVHPVPIRLLAYIPVVRSIYRVRTRSNNAIRAMASLTRYYVVRLLFGMKVHDFRNIQFHRTKVLQSFDLHGESSFLAVEAMVQARSRGLDLIEVPIKLLPRKRDVAKGITLAAIWRNCWDVVESLVVWGWRFRLEGCGKQGRIYRLLEPAFLNDGVIILCAPLFRRYR